MCVEQLQSRRPDAAKNVFTELNKLYTKLAYTRKDVFLNINKPKIVIVPPKTSEENEDEIIEPGYSYINYTMTITLLPHQILIVPDNYVNALNNTKIPKTLKIINGPQMR